MAMIYLIRHGQASFLKDDYDQLSDLGREQSTILGQAFKERNQQADHVIIGSLKRHHQTSEGCLSATVHNGEVNTDSRWNEYDHMELLAKHNPLLTDHLAIGAYLQKKDNPMKELQLLLNRSIEDWIANKHEYSLTWSDFKEGIKDALQEVATGLAENQTAWVFTSGGPVSAVLIELLKLDDLQFIQLQGRLVNSSVTKILVGKNKCTLSTYNEYSHLDHNPSLITYR